jgi:hypothetical protein
MNDELKKDARKLWISAGAMIALETSRMEARGQKVPSPEQEIAMRLDYCSAQLRQQYPNLSKSQASDIMFGVMKNWAGQFTPKKWWQFWKK